MYIILGIAVACTAGLSACLNLAGQGITYDPAKNYAAFLAPNSDFGKASVEAMKQKCSAEGLEIGPVEYYTTGTRDFAPALKKLTASKQVTVVCINFSSITDISNIKQSMVDLDYTGAYRYTTEQAKLGQ
jgi:ABC-type branched-subunit amino acid transport system substrate-binding protein